MDFLARLMSPKLYDALGRQFVVESRQGGKEGGYAPENTKVNYNT